VERAGRSQATGCSTNLVERGLQMLAGWAAVALAGPAPGAVQDAARPNLVMGSTVQVVLGEVLPLWQVEPRFMCPWCRGGFTCASPRPRQVRRG